MPFLSPLSCPGEINEKIANFPDSVINSLITEPGPFMWPKLYTKPNSFLRWRFPSDLTANHPQTINSREFERLGLASVGHNAACILPPGILFSNKLEFCYIQFQLEVALYLEKLHAMSFFKIMACCKRWKGGFQSISASCFYFAFLSLTMTLFTSVNMYLLQDFTQLHLTSKLNGLL